MWTKGIKRSSEDKTPDFDNNENGNGNISTATSAENGNKLSSGTSF